MGLRGCWVVVGVRGGIRGCWMVVGVRGGIRVVGYEVWIVMCQIRGVRNRATWQMTMMIHGVTSVSTYTYNMLTRCINTTTLKL